MYFEDKCCCRICGLLQIEAPWREDNQTPNYEICSCCGVEFGNEDYIPSSARAYREQWLQGGATWFIPKEKPKDWNLEEQLKQVPLLFR